MTEGRQATGVEASERDEQGRRRAEDTPLDRLPSPATVLALFEFIGSEQQRSLTEAIRYLDRPKSTVLRLLDTLVRSGLVQRVAAGEYAVTLKAWRIGSMALRRAKIDARVPELLRRAASETGETALYAAYENGFSLYLDKADSPQPVAASVAVGARTPAYATATGKVLLAHQPTEEIDRIIKLAKPQTSRTITDPAALKRELDEARRRGIAFTYGEWREGVAGAAAPVFDHTGSVVGAVGITCPLNRVEEKLEALGQIVQSVARELSLRLGNSGETEKTDNA